MFSLLAAAATFLALVSAAPNPQQACTNTPSTRSCWNDGFNIQTDYYNKWPNTGKVVEYHWEITNQTLVPDGFSRVVLAVNGQYPGPPVIANWGDTIVVHVTNKLTANGTSIHWHGVRMLHTPEADGAIGVTQCPIAPGETYTYRWQATQYGHSWYHSHFALQYSDGVVGSIIIHGPSSANWDVDTTPLLLTDWFHRPAAELAGDPQQVFTGIPPRADNGLINGLNEYSCAIAGRANDTTCRDSGKRYEMEFKPGKKHLIRITNSGTDVLFKFSIDNHKLKVISIDWVAIVPYETDIIKISIGQRYEMVVEATAPPGNYWMRAVPQITCLTQNAQRDNIRGIVRYSDSRHSDNPNSEKDKNRNKPSDPTSTPWPSIDECADEDLKNLVPVLTQNVGTPQFEKNLEPQLTPGAQPGQPPVIVRWLVNNNHYNPNTSEPSLLLIAENEGVQFPQDYAVTEVDSADGWAYFVIQTLFPIPHPFHLHGHDFSLLATGIGGYPTKPPYPNLNLINPPRRDVALLPASGFLVVAFRTDNPGAWLMHCHIAWHLNMGLAIQVIERRREITPRINGVGEVQRICKRWVVFDQSAGEDGA